MLKKFKIIKNYPELYIPIIIIIIVFFIGFYFYRVSFDNIILLLTFGSLLWYSLETRQLKNVTQRQLEPILFIYLNKEEQFLFISNLGKTAASNVFIQPILIRDNKIEFNLLRPIYYINPDKEKRIETTVSSNSGRSFNPSSSIERIISSMRDANLNKIEISIDYDTSFRSRENVKFIFDISGYMVDENDSTRICKIYQKFN